MSQSYLDYKLNSNSGEYEKDKRNLEAAKSDIFSYTNSLLIDSDNIYKKILALNKDITAINKQNTTLIHKLNTLNSQDNSAVEELKEKNFLYSEEYTYNVILVVIILGNIAVYIVNNYKSK